MGAQNFNFAPKCPPNGGFLSPNVAFLEENFPTRRKFSGQPNTGIYFGQLPPPRFHDATDCVFCLGQD